MSLDVKEPDSYFSSLFFPEPLLKAKPYCLLPSKATIKLDQNESPFDWEKDLKKDVLKKLEKESWNTYPEDYPRELKSLLAEYNQVQSKNIVLSPGSNYHISVLLNLFSAKDGADLVITRPSFPLFEGHCVYHNIPYRVWPLNESLEYDLRLLPELKAGSTVFFASPNNPVGNTLVKEDLIYLLETYPECYFIADEAYWEFVEDNFSPLLEQYSNLIIIRTFSKAMGSAGVRLSYVLGSESFCGELTKVTLPFIVNKFTTVAATCALQSKAFMAQVWEQVLFVKKERDRIYEEVSGFLDKNDFCKLKNSKANFLSLQCASQEVLTDIQETLLEKTIVSRNVSSPFLGNTLRISVGSSGENTKVIKCLKTHFSG